MVRRPVKKKSARPSGPRPAPARKPGGAASRPKSRPPLGKRVKRARSKKAPSSGEPHPEGERLQKVLAAAGLGSRRECEELITTGRVEIDGAMVTQLGTRVDPQRQEIRVDGMSLRRHKLLYFAVNKPQGVVSTNRDPAGRPRVIDLIQTGDERLFPIGRLDMYSEGLILVTNDGELANLLTHPRYEVAKTYRAIVAGRPEPQILERLRRGIHLAEGVAKVEEVHVKSQHKDSTTLDLVLREGKNREIRRVLARVGHKVLRLTRLAVGPVRLGELPSGAVRPLSKQEVESLYRDAGKR